MDTFEGKNIWIIGASSGIGRALALELNARGANLILSSRGADKLEQLKQELKKNHTVLPFDATSPEELAGAVKTASSALPVIDSVIYMAGRYKPMPLSSLDLEETAHIIDTNLMGPFRLVHAILPHFLKIRAGQIVLCASVAGYRGLPNGQPYSAVKAGLINLCETLRAEMRGTGIDVKVINPGFVRTPMTDKNSFDMPMMIEPEEAAREIADGLLSNVFEIHFPRRFTYLMKILHILPAWLYFKLAPR